MAKKIDADFQETTQNADVKNLIEQLKFELEKFGLKLVEDNPQNLKIEPLKNIKEDPAQIWIDKLKIELVRLGLKIIERFKAGGNLQFTGCALQRRKKLNRAANDKGVNSFADGR